MCISMVPEMVRTAPEPTPNVSNRVERGLLQLRMRRQAEVVVRRQVDDRLVIVGRVRLGLAFEDAQLAIQALLLQRRRVRCRGMRADRHLSQASDRISPSGKRSISVAPWAFSQLSTVSASAAFANAFRWTTTWVVPESFSDVHAAFGILRDALQARDALPVVRREAAAVAVGDRLPVRGGVVDVANLPRGIAERELGDRRAGRQRGDPRVDRRARSASGWIDARGRHRFVLPQVRLISIGIAAPSTRISETRASAATHVPPAAVGRSNAAAPNPASTARNSPAIIA